MRNNCQKYDKDDHSPFECQEGDDCAVCDILYDASEHDLYYDFVMHQKEQNDE